VWSEILTNVCHFFIIVADNFSELLLQNWTNKTQKSDINTAVSEAAQVIRLPSDSFCCCEQMKKSKTIKGFGKSKQQQRGKETYKHKSIDDVLCTDYLLA